MNILRLIFFFFMNTYARLAPSKHNKTTGNPYEYTSDRHNNKIIQPITGLINVIISNAYIQRILYTILKYIKLNSSLCLFRKPTRSNNTAIGSIYTIFVFKSTLYTSSTRNNRDNRFVMDIHNNYKFIRLRFRRIRIFFLMFDAIYFQRRKCVLSTHFSNNEHLFLFFFRREFFFVFIVV